MAGIYSQGGSAGHRYAGWLETVEAKNFQFGGKVFNGSPSAIYVGSNEVWPGWLTNATMQAIYGAFGQRDGTAVIKATNAYLNQLAASGQAGKDKATALAALINEDPMMVCSLGLQPQGVTMPKRYIQSLGNACFDLGVENHSNQVTYECEWYESRNANRWTVFGSTGASTNPGKWNGAWYHPSNTEIYSATGNTDGLMRNGYTVDGWNLLTATYTNGSATATLNGHSLSGTYSGSVQNNRSISLFGGKFGNNDIREIAPSGIRVTYWKKNESGHNHWFVPYRKKSGDSYTVELLDLETGNLATKYGSFTIPDISYTPSTP